MAAFDTELELQLMEVRNKLLKPPPSVIDLLNLLDQVKNWLVRVKQLPRELMQNFTPSLKPLVMERLFRHPDPDVKVAVASCIIEILRIAAPDAPYDDDQMKEVFQLIVSSFENLSDRSSHSFSKRISILETVAPVRCCLLMLDLECNDLIIEMFQHFLKSIRDYHAETVFTSMMTIMTLVLEESDEISTELLSPILASLKKDNEEVLPIAQRLAEKVLESCASQLKPYLSEAVEKLGISLDDYNSVVSSICQKTPVATVENNASIEKHVGDESPDKSKIAVVNRSLAMAGNDVFAELFDGDGVFKYYSDGDWKISSSGKSVPIINPTTRKPHFKVQACTEEEVYKVIYAAKTAQKSWAETPLWKRAELLHKAAAILKEHRNPIAECLVKEIAKPSKDAVTEVVRSGDLVSYCAEEGVRILGKGKFLVSDSFPGNERTKYCLTSKIPLGVILAIPPFSYPVHLAVSKIAPALIAGNSLVLKPPTQGAVAALHMVHCFHLAGFPKGLISCVTGKGSEIGDFLTMHPGVNCITFTGGDTGIEISKKAGMIPLQMELGGKDACIILDDADLDLAAANIVKGGFSYSGQRCTAVKIVLVMESVADDLVEKVKAKVAKLTVGLPEDDCDITPVVTESSANFIEGLVMDAKQKGATFCQEYKRDGNLIWPLLLDNVRAYMRIAWEEPFGPVLPVMRIRSVEEGIYHCNASKFGLQGCVFTRDINKAILISDAMKTGTVQINSAPARGPDHFPFQGLKNSGIGSQGITNSINMMTKIKTTVINLPMPSYGMG